jgi:glycosyltransferase involved in cell wall biosynthesis
MLKRQVASQSRRGPRPCLVIADSKCWLVPMPAALPEDRKRASAGVGSKLYRNITTYGSLPAITAAKTLKRSSREGPSYGTGYGEVGFDIVHQMTYTSFRVPGMLWQLDPPFVWGPIGALEQTTWALIPALGLRGALHFLARNLWNDWDRRFSRTPRLAFDKADGAIIAATEGIQKEIKRFYSHESTVICENGLPPVTRETPVRRLPSEPLHLLWCGLHIPRKALPFLFSALQLLPPHLKWKLIIAGDGPSSAAWRRLAQVKGVGDRCEWLGQVARETVLQRMQTAHALVVTSVYDLVSSVVVEALANGLPVICPDHSGFKDAITPDCGIKVPASSKRHLVRGLADSIQLLFDEDRRWELARGALARSAAYRWEAKARAIDEIYLEKVRHNRFKGVTQ